MFNQALDNTVKSRIMTQNILTQNGYTVEQSISGYWRLMKNGNVIYDDSACEDLNEDKETAEAFFEDYLKGKKVGFVKVYPTNMEIGMEGGEHISIQRDGYEELENKEEAREAVEYAGILLREDIDSIVSTMETYEWVTY